MSIQARYEMMKDSIDDKTLEPAFTVKDEGNSVEWDCCPECVARLHRMREKTLAKITTSVMLLSKQEEYIEVYIERMPLWPDDNRSWPDWLCVVVVPEGYASHRLMFNVGTTANIRTARGLFLSIKQKLRQCRPHGRVFGHRILPNWQHTHKLLPGSGLTLHAVRSVSAANRILEGICQRRCKRRPFTNRFRKCLQCIQVRMGSKSKWSGRPGDCFRAAPTFYLPPFLCNNHDQAEIVMAFRRAKNARSFPTREEGQLRALNERIVIS